MAIGVLLLGPIIIWVNYYRRQVGIMGYVWRESPNLARIGLIFLGVMWVGALRELVTQYGILPAEASQTASLVIRISMVVLSMAIHVMATVLFIRYLRSRERA